MNCCIKERDEYRLIEIRPVVTHDWGSSGFSSVLDNRTTRRVFSCVRRNPTLHLSIERRPSSSDLLEPGEMFGSRRSIYFTHVIMDGYILTILLIYDLIYTFFTPCDGPYIIRESFIIKERKEKTGNVN